MSIYEGEGGRVQMRTLPCGCTEKYVLVREGKWEFERLLVKPGCDEHGDE